MLRAENCLDSCYGNIHKLLPKQWVIDCNYSINSECSLATIVAFKAVASVVTAEDSPALYLATWSLLGRNIHYLWGACLEL